MPRAPVDEDELIAADQAAGEFDQQQQVCPEDEDVDDLDEKPPSCPCGLEAARLVSHSEKNPDRVFYKCSDQQVSPEELDIYVTSSCGLEAAGFAAQLWLLMGMTRKWLVCSTF